MTDNVEKKAVDDAKKAVDDAKKIIDRFSELFKYIRYASVGFTVVCNLYAICLLLTYDRYVLVLSFLPDNIVSNNIAAVFLALLNIFVILANIKYNQNKKIMFAANFFSVGLIITIIDWVQNGGINKMTGEIINQKLFSVRLNYTMQEKLEWLTEIKTNLRSYFPYDCYYYITPEHVSSFNVEKIKNKKELLSKMAEHFQEVNAEMDRNSTKFTTIINNIVTFCQNHPYLTLGAVLSVGYIVKVRLDHLGEGLAEAGKSAAEVAPAVGQLHNTLLMQQAEIKTIAKILDETIVNSQMTAEGLDLTNTKLNNIILLVYNLNKDFEYFKEDSFRNLFPIIPRN